MGTFSKRGMRETQTDEPLRYIGDCGYLPADKPIVLRGVVTCIGFKYGRPAVQMRVKGGHNRRIWCLLSQKQPLQTDLVWDSIEVEVHSHGSFGYNEAGKRTHLDRCAIVGIEANGGPDE